MDIIQKCTHPIRIVDRSNGGYMYVPCGHCQACITSYRSMWLQRLDAEAKSSKAVLFFTLTYDNDNVPSLTYDSGCNALFSNRSKSDDIYLDDYNFQLKSGLLNININSLPLLQNDKSIHPRVGYACKADVQKFIKRLRRRLDYDTKNLISYVSSTCRSFRYFITSEYGPCTYRPHYHGLLYFNNIDVAKAVEKHYLRESWQFCDKQNVDISQVQTNASSYVSKYVRCDTRIPDLLKIPSKTSSFFLCSRKPAIGNLPFDKVLGIFFVLSIPVLSFFNS